MSDENPHGPTDPTPPNVGQNPPPNWGNAYPTPPPTQPYPGQPAYGAFTPPPPKHGQATTSMVLGIISLAGLFTCLVPILLAPAAWILGAKAVKEIDASPTALSGRGEAMAGKITGIIGTVLLVLILIGVAVLIVIAVNGGFDSSYEYDSGTFDSAYSASAFF